MIFICVRFIGSFLCTGVCMRPLQVCGIDLRRAGPKWAGIVRVQVLCRASAPLAAAAVVRRAGTA